MRLSIVPPTAWLARLGALALVVLPAIDAAHAQVVKTIYNFGSQASDGTKPTSGLVLGHDGNFYGTTSAGGTLSAGTVYKVTPQGVETRLYSFTTNSGDGNTPNGPLVQGGDDTFYGTTLGGGPANNGTIFKVTPAGAETTMFTFGAMGIGGHVGAQSGLTFGIDGNLYGVTLGGNSSGANSGTVFKITPSGSLTTLYAFGTNSNDGSNPAAALLQGGDGNFYGTTTHSSVPSSSISGTVFRIAPQGVETILYAFGTNAGDGTVTQGALILGSDGNFYGTSRLGGANVDAGAAFKITPGGTETVLHDFGTQVVNGFSADGGFPYGALIEGGDGNFYGTTSNFGISGKGTIFRLSPAGVLTTLFIFGTKTGDGSAPECALVKGPDGNYYGTTMTGGTTGNGTVFRLNLHPTLSPVTLVSSNATAALAKAGDTLTLTFSVDESLASAGATIAGRPVTVTNFGSFWRGTITVTDDFPQGPVAFSINATDNGGYSSGPITATTDSSAVSIDLNAPQLPQVTISSSNPAPAYARAGDTVTVAFTASEPLQTPAVLIAGQTASVTNPGGNLWTASVSVTNAFAEGPASISILATDLAGNAAAPVTATSDGSSVTLELTPPSLSAVSMASSNANPAYAKAGDHIVVGFSASTAIQAPNVVIAGQTATAVNGGGNSWTASVTVTNDFSAGPSCFLDHGCGSGRQRRHAGHRHLE